MSQLGMEAQQPLGDNQGPPKGRKIAQYVNEIVLYERETDSWDKKSKRIIERYKDSRNTAKDGVDSNAAARFNVLWSNIQTLLPAIFAKNPKPDIQRRFKDADPVGRVTSDVLERCASYFCDNDLFAAMMRQCCIDYLLPGRGTTWTRYVPHIRTEGVGEVTDDVVEGAGEKPEPLEIVEYEEAIPDYVHRSDFGHNICRTWEEVWVVWRKVYLDREQLRARFQKGPSNKNGLSADIVNSIPLDHRDKNLKDQTLDDGIGKATIFEAWDKNRKEALWFHRDIPDALDMRPDPLELDGFFPCPRPMLSNLANDSLIPVPDYIEYQDQAIELDSLTARIASLTKAVKVAGVYDASAQGLSRLLSEGTENQLIPVEQWALFAEKGGLDGAISFMPLKDIVEALTSMYAARDQVKKDLAEITGLSDLVRGQGVASESATAQQIKSNFATMRIGDKQKEVQRFAREVIRLIVDIICGHFQLDTIKKISGVRLFTNEEKAAIGQYQQATQQFQQMQQAQQQPPQPGMPPAQPMPPMAPPQPPPVLQGLKPDQIEVMMNDPTWEEVDALIRDDAMRCFRIDIETDSTIKADEEADKASRIEFVRAIGEYLAQALPAAQAQPELASFLIEGLSFLARGFPVGKNMESALSIAAQKIEKAASQPKQAPPDPEMIKAQAEIENNKQKMQLEQQKAQAQLQNDQARGQMELQNEQARMQGDAELARYKADQEAQLQMQKLAFEHELAKMELDQKGKIELEKARISASASVQSAEITADAKAEAQPPTGDNS